jgi:hypothetical protein
MSIANPYAAPAAPSKRRKSGPMPEWISDPLRATRPWVLFLSILGFICSLPMLLYTGLSVMLGLGAGNIVVVLVGGLFGLAGFACYFLPSYLLLKYGSAIGRCVEGNDLNQLQAVLKAQASFWRTCGIIVVVMFLLSILASVAVVIFGLALPGMVEAAGK